MLLHSAHQGWLPEEHVDEDPLVARRVEDVDPRLAVVICGGALRGNRCDWLWLDATSPCRTRRRDKKETNAPAARRGLMFGSDGPEARVLSSTCVCTRVCVFLCMCVLCAVLCAALLLTVKKPSIK